MNNIFIGNLGLDATEHDTRCVFERYGTVERFRIMTDRLTGQPRGFAFVEMADDADAAKAIIGVNGIELKGRAMNVSAARPQLYRSFGGPTTRRRAD